MAWCSCLLVAGLVDLHTKAHVLEVLALAPAYAVGFLSARRAAPMERYLQKVETTLESVARYEQEMVTHYELALRLVGEARLPEAEHERLQALATLEQAATVREDLERVSHEAS